MDYVPVFGRLKPPLWERVEEYRRRQDAIPTKNQALIELITLGLDKDEQETPAQ